MGMGDKRFIARHGRMSPCKHSKVLSALEKRALRYCRKSIIDADEALYNKVIDETGTVSTAGLADLNDESDGGSLGGSFITATALEEEGIRGASQTTY